MSDIKSLAGKGAWVMMQRSFKRRNKDENNKKRNDKRIYRFLFKKY